MTRSALILLSILLSSICFGQRKEYYEALNEHTVWDYNNFLKKFPDSKFAPKIIVRRNQLCHGEWAKLKVSEYKWPEHVQDFLKGCSECKYGPAARDTLEEVEWRNTAIYSSEALQDYSEFIEKYPNSLHKIEALKRIKTIKWNMALNSGRKADFDSFLNEYPNSEYRAKAEMIIDSLARYALLRAVKRGDVENVQQTVLTAEQDMKSKALMEAVDDLLYTGLQYKWNDQGMIDYFNGRTSKIPPETCMEIIEILLKNGADPERFSYADFASIEVKKKETEKKEKEFLKQVSETGSGEIRTQIGGSELTGTYIDYGTGGLSIREVAIIHEAKELIQLLDKK